MILSLIVAADEHNVIGAGNKLLWSLPDDMKRFRELTRGHPVIMGRKTHESIGRVLPGRRNIIISRRKDLRIEGCETVGSLDAAIALTAGDSSGEVFVIGGGEIYSQAMGKADRIYLTRVHSVFAGDTLFPEIDAGRWKKVADEEHAQDAAHQCAFTFETYDRC